MHYRRAVPLLALLAIGACSGDRLVSARKSAAPVMVVERTTVQWRDSAGMPHAVQLPDRLVPQVLISRKTFGDRRERVIPVAMAASSQGYRIYDSLGTAWSLMILASGTQVPKFYVRIANDTATYSFGPSWILSGDTAYALTQMNDTLVTSVATITATQTFSAGIAIPTAAPSAGQSPLRWLAQAGRAAASLAEFLALPDAAEAQVIVPPPAFLVPVTVCPSQSSDVFFSGLGLVGSIFAVFITAATPAIVPSTLAGMYTGYTFGRKLGDLDRCLGGGGAGPSDSTTGGHHARAT